MSKVTYQMKGTEIKKAVRKAYAKIVTKERSCCGPVGACGDSTPVETKAKSLGYTEEELKQVPDDANLGVGCGNPLALALLHEGETVLDLGSGAGFDCFVAANRVGDKGKVIGVDLTPEMIEKAQENAAKGKYKNVEFRLGDIENLPADDVSVDVVISNCVINLAPDKARVFGEAFRVLKPGGRLVISDIVLVRELPAYIKNSIEAYATCIAGAIMEHDYLQAIKEAGFEAVKVIKEKPLPVEFAAPVFDNSKVTPEELGGAAQSAVSISVHALKPNMTP